MAHKNRRTRSVPSAVAPSIAQATMPRHREAATTQRGPTSSQKDSSAARRIAKEP